MTDKHFRDAWPAAEYHKNRAIVKERQIIKQQVPVIEEELTRLWSYNNPETSFILDFEISTTLKKELIDLGFIITTDGMQTRVMLPSE